MERHSFCIVLGDSKLCGNCVFPQNFHTRKLDEITVFFGLNGTISVSALAAGGGNNNEKINI